MQVDGPMFRVLGPVLVERDGQTCVLGGPRQKLVLAQLLANPNQVVSLDELIEGVWGDDPPNSPRSSLHSYVSNLRKVLGNGRLDHSEDGYVIHVLAEDYDALRFEQLTEVAGAVTSADPRSAVGLLDEALGLWRGPAFGDLRYASSLRMESMRLEELRLLAEEERIEARLALGGHRSVVGRLRGLVAEHPLRERLCGQLMVALYRSGRQAEALAAFRQLRTMLVDQMGVEPCRELWDLEDRILQHEASLDLESAPVAISAGAGPAGPPPLPEHGVPVAAGTDGSPIGRPRLVSLSPSKLASLFLAAGLVMGYLTSGLLDRPRNCVVSPRSVTAWWSADGTGRDRLGSSTAQLMGDATFTPGLVGEAFLLDGSGDFVDLRRQDLQFGTGDFTVALWASFASTDGEQVLVEKWVQRYDQPSEGWTFTKLDGQALGIYMDQMTGTAQEVVTAPLDLPEDAWTHFAVRREEDLLEILVDGSVQAARRYGEGIDLTSFTSIRVGHRGSMYDTAGSQDPEGFFLNGAVDEVIISAGTAMSHREIADIVVAREAGICRVPV